MRWPNVVKLGVGYLTAALGVRSVTLLPSDLVANLPIVRVSRGPGSDDAVTDSPLLDVEVFAADDDAMWSLAEDARQAMHALSGKSVNGALVDYVTTVAAPTFVDYGNPAVRRAVASYRLALRKI